jgi:hypothetical protein
VGSFFQETRISGGTGERTGRSSMAGPSLALGAACQTQPGSNRQVSNAIHTIAIIRAKHQPETRDYLDRRIVEGKTKREALRPQTPHPLRRLQTPQRERIDFIEASLTGASGQPTHDRPCRMASGLRSRPRLRK